MRHLRLRSGLRLIQANEGSAEATLALDDIPAEPKDGGQNDADERRHVLDDINWRLVAIKVPTRTQVQCMTKWYRELAPSMVATGKDQLLKTAIAELFWKFWSSRD